MVEVSSQWSCGPAPFESAICHLNSPCPRAACSRQRQPEGTGNGTGQARRRMVTLVWVWTEHENNRTALVPLLCEAEKQPASTQRHKDTKQKKVEKHRTTNAAALSQVVRLAIVV